ncbi:MAG TPA: hypothetical protein VK573_12445 [Gemmatimonadales bacterium]|nr:hypothetical protein [Gemmatimonadales bacterium]
MNLIGDASSGLKLARHYQITESRGVAPTVAPEIVPVCLVDDLSDFDLSPDTSFREFYSVMLFVVPVGLIGRIYVSVDALENVMVRIRSVAWEVAASVDPRVNDGWHTAVAVAGVPLINYSQRVIRQRNPIAGASPFPIVSGRVRGSIDGIGAVGATIDQHIWRGRVTGTGSSGEQVVETFIGPGHAWSFGMRDIAPAGGASGSLSIAFQERPFRRVGGE